MDDSEDFPIFLEQTADSEPEPDELEKPFPESSGPAAETDPLQETSFQQQKSSLPPAPASPPRTALADHDDVVVELEQLPEPPAAVVSSPPQSKPQVSKLEQSLLKQNHGVYLSSWLLRCCFLSGLLDVSEELQAVLLSSVPRAQLDAACSASQLPTAQQVATLTRWFHGRLGDVQVLRAQDVGAFRSCCRVRQAQRCLETQLSQTWALLLEQPVGTQAYLPAETIVLLFVALCRSLGWQARLLYGLQPPPLDRRSATAIAASAADPPELKLRPPEACACHQDTQLQLADARLVQGRSASSSSSSSSSDSPSDSEDTGDSENTEDSEATEDTEDLEDSQDSSAGRPRKRQKVRRSQRSIASVVAAKKQQRRRKPAPAAQGGPWVWAEIRCRRAVEEAAEDSNDSEETEDEEEILQQWEVDWECVDPVDGRLGRAVVFVAPSARQRRLELPYVVASWSLPMRGVQSSPYFAPSPPPRFAKDLTAKYAANWDRLKARRVSGKQMVWWRESFRLLGAAPADPTDDPSPTAKSLQALDEATVPTTLAAAKKHPKFCIEKHALKFEMVFPTGVEHSVGKIVLKNRGQVTVHLVYPRSHLQKLAAVDRWRRQLRQVKEGELPVKIVKKRGRLSSESLKNQLHLFGEWQTEPMEHPEAKGGVIPVNAFGNVEVMKGCVLPKGTVHLNLPRIAMAARTAGVEHVPAVDGFRFARGGSVPNIKGIVVLTKDKAKVLQAHREQEKKRLDNQLKKARSQALKDWRTLLRSALVHNKVAKSQIERDRSRENQVSGAPLQETELKEDLEQQQQQQHQLPTQLTAVPLSHAAGSLEPISYSQSSQMAGSQTYLCELQGHEFTSSNSFQSSGAWEVTCSRCGASGR